MGLLLKGFALYTKPLIKVFISSIYSNVSERINIILLHFLFRFLNSLHILAPQTSVQLLFPETISEYTHRVIKCQGWETDQ